MWRQSKRSQGNYWRRELLAASYKPGALLTVSALLPATGLGASYLPARRATKVDPVVALREE